MGHVVSIMGKVLKGEHASGLKLLRAHFQCAPPRVVNTTAPLGNVERQAIVKSMWDPRYALKFDLMARPRSLGPGDLGVTLGPDKPPDRNERWILNSLSAPLEGRCSVELHKSSSCKIASMSKRKFKKSFSIAWRSRPSESNKPMLH